MIDTPAFLDANRPDVPDLVIPRGVTPFHLEGAPVRGRLVQLGPLADALLTRRTLDDAAMTLGGESLVLVAGLSATLKFQGSFSLQIKGDGPIQTLVADSTESGNLRLYIRAEPSETPLEGTASDLLGEGYLAFTVDPGAGGERYQGIVGIDGDSLAHMAMHYFDTSEQHDCWIRLACARTDAGWRASGLILERIASGGGTEATIPDAKSSHDDWETALTLAETVTQNELLDDALTAETLLYRLFGTMNVAASRPRALAFGCRCSRARLVNLLETFSDDDLDHMVVGENIVMSCEFCNIDFRFDRAELKRAEPEA